MFFDRSSIKISRFLLPKIAIMYGVRDSHPNIDQTDAGDHSADKAQIEDELESGPPGKQRVLGPEARPGEHQDQHSCPDGDGNLYHQQQALRPDRRVSVGWNRMAGIFLWRGRL